MKQASSFIERVSFLMTQKIGTPASIFIHTILFMIMFILPFFGVKFEQMLLILTTLVSLEAIYLALFIQMTVNRTHEGIEDVSEDIQDVGEDIKEIQEGDEEEDKHDEGVAEMLKTIERKLSQLQRDVNVLKK
jgi:low affinity Fe/Cu permease